MDKNLETKGSDCKVCDVCSEPVEKVTYLHGFNRSIRGPVLCKCRRDSLAAKEIAEKNVEKQIRLKQIINNSLMDERFRNSTFENWDLSKGNSKMMNIGLKYAEKFQEMKKEGIGLLIYGEPGNGKTYVSSCIANRLMERLTPVICISVNGILDKIKQTFNTWGSEGEETIIRSLSNADLLVLDDLGTEQDKDWPKTVIYNILDNRYRNRLPLIVTTNISLKELEAKYHKRTYDRLIEMCTPVENDGKSIRQIYAKEKTNVLKRILSE